MSRRSSTSRAWLICGSWQSGNPGGHLGHRGQAPRQAILPDCIASQSAVPYFSSFTYRHAASVSCALDRTSASDMAALRHAYLSIFGFCSSALSSVYRSSYVASRPNASARLI